ncbi:hypothetical protein [Winogradskyella sp. PG-2]|uniref:hypothetical protein n=1 Tax=Winogradskyella sp. PG-2 TaxID=754409 RepID=UPI0005ED4F7D|nr:hypothetical protein [Winogradskyella sp. PG-2]
MSNYYKHKMRGKSPGEIAGMIIFGIIFITGLAILFGFVIMWLWNWLMPMIFGLTTLTYWQAVGVFILFKILLGGCGGCGGKEKKHSKKSNCKIESKGEFSKWKHYDDFWKEEGNNAYEAYVNRITTKEETND